MLSSCGVETKKDRGGSNTIQYLVKIPLQHVYSLEGYLVDDYVLGGDHLLLCYAHSTYYRVLALAWSSSVYTSIYRACGAQLRSTSHSQICLNVGNLSAVLLLSYCCRTP